MKIKNKKKSKNRINVIRQFFCTGSIRRLKKRHFFSTQETKSLLSKYCPLCPFRTDNVISRWLQQVPAKTCESHRKVTATDRLNDWLRLPVCSLTPFLSKQSQPNCLPSFVKNFTAVLYYIIGSLFLLFHATVLSVEYVCLFMWRSLTVCLLNFTPFHFNSASQKK